MQLFFGCRKFVAKKCFEINGEKDFRKSDDASSWLQVLFSSNIIITNNKNLLRNCITLYQNVRVKKSAVLFP
jgi:hypothetical protein